LIEASGFVVFFRDPDAGISAAIIDATDPHLERQVIQPSGLSGWSWGILGLHGAPIDPATDLVGRPGQGLNVFRGHFTRFRPLVSATALGTAAGVHTLVAQSLVARSNAGILPRVRNNALITLGRTHAEITASLLAALTVSRLAWAGHPAADLAARVGKAAGVDAAHRAVAELAPLIGAAGFQQDHRVAKARADLTGLLYADGIHDSLYRSGGISLLNEPILPAIPARPDVTVEEFGQAA
jgi:alkylation response protein AidB-like acyl-CoA dehydrogenase